MLREVGFIGPVLIYEGALVELPFEHGGFFTGGIRQLELRLNRVSHYALCIRAEHAYARVKIAEQIDRALFPPLALVHEKDFMELMLGHSSKSSQHLAATGSSIPTSPSITNA